ncbi:hypothetical protein KIH31_02525 [Paenarthrobacter sp. DKR-5]|nr:hypothetical protein [Paenarthrobacter sp. DKR-5]MBT1001466.1 hypothetical protein [Paenarthrobacter sp. DKR-5]
MKTHPTRALRATIFSLPDAAFRRGDGGAPAGAATAGGADVVVIDP